MMTEEQGTQPQTSDNTSPPADVDPGVAAFVKNWSKKIKAAKKYHETAHKRMRKCMQLARDGAEESWVKAEKYVVPIINRHINVAVGQLYAKAPTAIAKRKHRRMGTVWDGKIQSLNEAAQQVRAATAVNMPADPTAAAIIQDAEKVKAYIEMMDGLADTLGILFEHFMTEKAAQYKQHFKALVRRVKVTGVGYVKLGFHRMLEPDPDVVTRIHETTERIATIKQLLAQNAREPFDEESAELEQLQTAMTDLQNQDQLIVNEGPLLAFPGSTRIIIDTNCLHLKTLSGAEWWAEEFDMLPERIETIYGIDVKGQFERYKETNDQAKRRWSDKEQDLSKQELAKVWFVQNRTTGQEFTICDGYSGYLKPPQTPDVQLQRFFTLFPLVFNECEDENEIFPPSDVWQARDTQSEYNRNRQGLREHRKANRPAYLSTKGTFEEDDLKKLQEHEVAEIIETNVTLEAGQKIEDRLQAKPVMAIDQKLYETESLFQDLLRVVGSQEADLGTPSGKTATESSIAEQSRGVSLSDNVDELDDFLALIADGMAELMLREMSREIVTEIVGPGAVWPSLPQNREEVIESIVLAIRAGSSGRPNQAAELAKLERAMPFVVQMPNVNPIPITEKYLDLLDIDIEDSVVEGLPSIQAINAMMAGAAKQQQTGKPNNPSDQGPQGGQNAPQPNQGQPTPQAAHPAPHIGPGPANGAPA